MNKIRFKIICSILLTVFVLTMFTGCGPKTETAADEAQTQEEAVAEEESSEAEVAESSDAPAEEGKDTIVIAMANEPPSLTTNDHNAIYADYMNQLTNNGLFRLDENSMPVPDLVESYENVSDTEWLFTIYEGVKFHDGSTMTADDIKASLDWAKTFAAVTPYTMSYTAVEVVDDQTVKIITDGPSSTLLFDLAHHANYILPKALIDAGHNFNEEPVGSGPYKFVSWTIGDKMEFTRFDDYFDAEAMPAIKNIVWKFIPEGSARSIGLETGEIDLLVEVDTTDITRLQENEDIDVLIATGYTHWWLMLNNEAPPFDNALVRKAISAAIDRDAVIEVSLDGLGEKVISQTPSYMMGSTDTNAEGYDVEKAKQYLAESGIDPASIKLEVICSSEQKLKATEVIQANLAEIGITDVAPVSMDLATYLTATGEGNYTGSIGGYQASNMIAFLQGTFHSSSINGSNKTRFNNPEVDALIDEAASTIDDAKREALLIEATELLNELAPQAPIWQSVNVRAYSKDLGGVALNAAGVLRVNMLYWK